MHHPQHFISLTPGTPRIRPRFAIKAGLRATLNALVFAGQGLGLRFGRNRHLGAGIGTGIGIGIGLTVLVLSSCSTQEDRLTVNGANANSTSVGTQTSKQSATAAPIKTNVQLWPQITSEVPQLAEQEQAIATLVAQMSVEQKVAQMIQPDIRWITVEDMRRYGFGSYQSGGGAYPNNDKYAPIKDWVALADALFDASIDDSLDGTRIPTLWASDAVHGLNNVVGATLFPHNSGLGAMRNPELIRKIGQVTALETRTTGIDMSFAPTLAVARDDRWGRAYESYSEDPALVKLYAAQMVKGLQGEFGSEDLTDDLSGDSSTSNSKNDRNDFLNEDHVISTAKHFLGDGGTTKGVDQGDTAVSEQELYDIHAQGYVSALEAGVQSVMASFNSWHGDKLHGHKYLLTDVLKDRMGFDGMVIGDWNGHGQIPGCDNTQCAATVNAGLDVFLVPEDWRLLYENTIKHVNDGTIPMARINDAVTRILRVKMRAGLFNAPRPSARAHAGDTSLLGAPAHRAVARQAVRESLVLLKNSNQLLPLSPGRKFLVTGDGADNISKQTGGWTITWQGTDNKNSDFPGGSSILNGIEHAVSAAGGQVEYSENGNYSVKPDTAIVVIGENPYAEFVGDLTQLEYQFPGKSDLRLLKRLKADNIPTVVVFLTGRPLWVNKELNAADAFVVAWLPGSEGNGIADVIFSDKNDAIVHDFKGRLPFSWPNRVEQRILNIGDADYAPLFPYGFGLGYAQHTDASQNTVAYPLHEHGSADSAQLVSLNLFHRKIIEPWQLTTSDANALTVNVIQREVQADAREAQWTGTGTHTNTSAGKVSLSLETNEAQNVSRYIENGALQFDLQIRQKPSAKVELSFGGKAVQKTVDISEHLSQDSLSEWGSMTIDLSCLTDNANDYSKITEGFVVTTEGALNMAFSNIQLEPEADGEADIRCE
ncbi:MAG: beta-glucosidase [Flavobacteriales bacterium]|jgi:beta-glucosidase